MPEYHKLKGDTPSLTFFKSPELAAQAALDAQRILQVDAAILFADLLPIIEPLGFELDYVAGIGPVIGNPIKTRQTVENIPSVDAPDEYDYIDQAVRMIRADLPQDVALIGFAGAPFTLASYLLEGQSSKNFVATKQLMYREPDMWAELLQKLARVVADYVNLQIEAGANAIQIFDSWIGCLSESDFNHSVAPATSWLMSQITGKVPIIYFGTGNAHLVTAMDKCGSDLLALDWRTPLAETWRNLGSRSIQGNLDPTVLYAKPEVIASQAGGLLESVADRPGHIFNLGHGILPTTPVDNVKFLVDFVHVTTTRLRKSE